MTTQEVKRKLTAILSADVKGYSRLMGEDERGTVHTLNAYKEVMTNLIQQHRGRVVDAPGDREITEAQHIAQEHPEQRPERAQLSAVRHLQLQHHDRDDDRHHPVTERLQPVLLHSDEEYASAHLVRQASLHPSR